MSIIRKLTQELLATLQAADLPPSFKVASQLAADFQKAAVLNYDKILAELTANPAGCNHPECMACKMTRRMIRRQVEFIKNVLEPHQTEYARLLKQTDEDFDTISKLLDNIEGAPDHHN